jgi:hypothetical protein
MIYAVAVGGCRIVVRRDADAQSARPWRRCAGEYVPDGRSRRGRVAITRIPPRDAGRPSRRPPPRRPSPRPPACGWGCARRGGRLHPRFARL